jgi:hypothetical protein
MLLPQYNLHPILVPFQKKMFIKRSLAENKNWLRIMKELAMFLG